MAHLTLAGRSDDGTRLLLVDDRGVEHTLAIDATLRAALRGEHARIGQLEIEMDSALRPRDIQARIRAGETPEAVAQAAQTTVDQIMPFASPVLAERAHVADRAQRSSVRRRSGDSGARTLGDAIGVHLRAANVDPRTVEWDAWRREDGRWTLTAAYAAGRRSGSATFSYDMRGNFVTMDDDDARWLVGDSADRAERPARTTETGARGRRLSAVPGHDTDELPLGEDAISMVTDETGGGADDRDITPEHHPLAQPDPEAPHVGGPADLDVPDDPEATTAEQPAVVDPEAPVVPATDRPAGEATDEQADEASLEPAAEEQPTRKPRRSRGRTSVPSWDEIMFGGPSE